MNKVFCENINDLTVNNNYFREVLSTTTTMQLTVMSLNPNEEIGNEIHPYISQFIRVEQGHGLLVIDNEEYCELHDDSAIIIPPNTLHNIINLSRTKKLKLYSIYSPPNHPSDRIDVNNPESD